MKILLGILVLLELFFALLLISPMFVDSHALALAVCNYSRERTEENKKKMQAEQKIVAKQRLQDQMVVVGLFGANTYGLIIVCRRLSRKS